MIKVVQPRGEAQEATCGKGTALSWKLRMLRIVRVATDVGRRIVEK